MKIITSLGKMSLKGIIKKVASGKIKSAEFTEIQEKFTQDKQEENNKAVITAIREREKK